jgi:hypothetical protein
MSAEMFDGCRHGYNGIAPKARAKHIDLEDESCYPQFDGTAPDCSRSIQDAEDACKKEFEACEEVLYSDADHPLPPHHGCMDLAFPTVPPQLSDEWSERARIASDRQVGCIIGAHGLFEGLANSGTPLHSDPNCRMKINEQKQFECAAD